jgi:hypothetical protein
MKKIINYSLGLFLFATILSACSNYLDINNNPNYPATASTPLLFASGTTWSAAILGCDVQLVGAMWAQHYAQNNTSQQYATIDQYNLSNSNSYFTRYWSAIYSGALPDLSLAISQSEKSGDWNYWLASKVLTAYNFNILVSLFETVPFTEALQGNDNLTPKYDDSKTVDAGIISLLDAAIAKKADASALSLAMGGKDMIFGKNASGTELANAANITLWVKFAKTLKLKVLMRDFTTNQTAIQALLTEGDLLVSDAKLANFMDQENKSNPLYENDRRKLNTTTNIRASATLVAFLNANHDPRVAAFAEPTTQMFQNGSIVNVPSNVVNYRGIDQGAYGSTTFSSNVFPTSVHSRAVLAATDPVYFMSAAESYFLQAEAWARIGNTGNAKSAYDNAVKAAFSRWGYDGSTFVATGGAYEFQSGSLDAMLKSILMQKWVSSVRTDSWNAFFDICRTGIPAMGTQTVTDQNNIGNMNSNYVIGTLAPPVVSVLLTSQYPHRFLIPKTSSDYNPNAPAVIPIYQKMWWHK